MPLIRPSSLRTAVVALLTRLSVSFCWFDWAAAAFFLDRCLLGSDLPRQVGDLLLV